MCIRDSNKYQNGKIYKITDIAYTECYIGSTVQPLCNRMAEHRKHYHLYKNKSGVETLQYTTSYKLFDTFGIDNCKIELIELWPCMSKEDLRKREGHWIKQEACVNTRIEGRTIKEWVEDNKDKLQEYGKQYRREHAEQISETNRKYRVEHAAYICLKKKLYNEINKDRIKARRDVLHVCQICGFSYTLRHKARHEKTQRHLTALDNNK